MQPNICIFENVSSFLKTICTGLNGDNHTINEELDIQLSEKYHLLKKVVNLKNYGCNSSRLRTIVIGVKKEYLNVITPFEIFPQFSNELSLSDVIGNLKPLTKMGQIDNNNYLHYFKPYLEYKRDWIKVLKEGQSAMDNPMNLRPYYFDKNGNKSLIKNLFGDKFKRQHWTKVGPCIHTVSDCLNSQNTIHPKDDRVFSIAELMKLMSIPSSFKWNNHIKENTDIQEKIEWISKNDSMIRKVIGEAVPTEVFYRMAKNIKNILYKENDPLNFSNDFEKNNKNKIKHAAYYTSRINLNYIYDALPDFSSDSELVIVEPSVGLGNCIYPLFKKYSHLKKVKIIAIDIDKNVFKDLKENLKIMNTPKNFILEFINKDFNEFIYDGKIDLIIGNPPFLVSNKKGNILNTVEDFFKKSFSFTNNIIFVCPKMILNSSTYKNLRNLLIKKNIELIVDFNEYGFKDVKVETILLKISPHKNVFTKIISVHKNFINYQKNNYIFAPELPYWLIYRNQLFDDVFNSLKRNIFNIYKNYEIGNTKCVKNNINNSLIWVIKSKNISLEKPELIHKNNYDIYCEKDLIKNTRFYKFLKENKNIYLIPNLSYFPRVCPLKEDVIPNGSIIVALLKEKNSLLTEKQLEYFYSNEFREYYQIAQNFSTRTLNVNETTINFFGVKDE
ncbi:MAG: DNA cytosine methyltransferase [Metamycoplasmataceae bacterium]